MGRLTRRTHRILGLVLLLPICAWALTGFFFFVKPGYGAAYGGLNVRRYSLEGTPMPQPRSEWLEMRMVRTILGDHLIARTEQGTVQLDPATLQPRPLPEEGDIRRLIVDAIAKEQDRYGEIASVTREPGDAPSATIETTTGVTIELDWASLGLQQSGRDTRRIDALYRVHYLQWTGIKAVDRVLGVIGLASLLVLAFFGLRLAFWGAGGMSAFPERIVCLTEETTETLYLLGQGDRVVGISGYTVRPPEARSKPKVSAFISANFEKIEALRPDLVLAFSDLQADIAAALVRRGMTVMVFNQRSVPEILQMIRTLGGLVGCAGEAERLASGFASDLERIRRSAARFPTRLRVFFEEWDDPLISGIRWVEELVAIAGGDPIFPELQRAGLARDRIVERDEVARRDPEVVFASWCGKKVRKATIVKRRGWGSVSAVREDRIFEIKSTYILQPGPASLTEGVRQLHAAMARIHGIEIDRELAPSS